MKCAHERRLNKTGERTQRECTEVYKLRYETCVETRGGS